MLAAYYKRQADLARQAEESARQAEALRRAELPLNEQSADPKLGDAQEPAPVQVLEPLNDVVTVSLEDGEDVELRSGHAALNRESGGDVDDRQDDVASRWPAVCEEKIVAGPEPAVDVDAAGLAAAEHGHGSSCWPGGVRVHDDRASVFDLLKVELGKGNPRDCWGKLCRRLPELRDLVTLHLFAGRPKPTPMLTAEGWSAVRRHLSLAKSDSTRTTAQQRDQWAAIAIGLLLLTAGRRDRQDDGPPFM